MLAVGGGEPKKLATLVQIKEGGAGSALLASSGKSQRALLFQQSFYQLPFPGVVHNFGVSSQPS